MRMQGLSFDNAPALHIPLRFFNTAPWLGVLAGLLLLAASAEDVATQWSPALLATTHLITLGFMAMIMLGALFQVLPVISGETIPGNPFIATLVHLSLLAGTLLLAVGFGWLQYQLFWFALPLLIACFSCFLLALGSLLVRNISGGDSIFAIRLAAISLLITILLGLFRATNYFLPLGIISPPNISYLHMAWGLLGWTLLLVMGVSYQVIPMFHITANYPSRLARAVPLAVFLSLLLLSGTLFIGVSALLQHILVVLLFLIVVTYPVYSLWLLHHRKRKIADVTVDFWRLAMVNLIAAALLFLLLYIYALWPEQGGYSQRFNIVLGVLVIYGFACSVIMGMLQKIIPFLIYMHLQKRCIGNYGLLKTLPHMGTIIPVTRSRWQLRLHVGALIMLLLAILLPALLFVAALLVALDFCWLGYCVAKATRLYRQTLLRVRSHEG